MKDEKKLCLLRRGIRPTQTALCPSSASRQVGSYFPLESSRDIVVLNYPQRLLHASHSLIHVQFMGTSFLPSKECWLSPSEEDSSNLENLIGRALEEELSTLVEWFFGNPSYQTNIARRSNE